MITAEGVEHSSAKLLGSGTLLYSIFASIGAVAILGVPAATNQAIAGLTLRSSGLDRDYLYYWLCSRGSTSKAAGRGAAQNNINLTILRNMEISIPPTNVQRRIVMELDHICGLIDCTRRQLSLLDDLIKSRFVEMFESESWAVTPAREVLLDMRNGVSPSREGSYHVGVLTLSAITQGSFDAELRKEGTFSSDPPLEKRVAAGEFYICRGNGNRNLVGVGEYSSENHPDLVFPDTMIAARMNTDLVCPKYLRYAWGRPGVRTQIESRARTTNGTFKINQRMISGVLLPIPPLDLQREFAAFADAVDKSQVAAQRFLRVSLMVCEPLS